MAISKVNFVPFSRENGYLLPNDVLITAVDSRL